MPAEQRNTRQAKFFRHVVDGGEIELADGDDDEIGEEPP
jgi:hypothetical protein